MDMEREAWLDTDRRTERITALTEDEVCLGERASYCTGMTRDRKPADAPEPQVGDLLTIWPYGGWWPIRGKAFNTRVWYWRPQSEAEREARARLYARRHGKGSTTVSVRRVP